MRKWEKQRLGSLVLHTCPVRGKTFIPAAYYSYHERKKGYGRLVCSYACENKTRREK